MRRKIGPVSLIVLLAIASSTGLRAKPKEATTPAPAIADWSFMVGDWKLDSKRYALDDGRVLERNAGRTRFSLTLEGQRIAEQGSTTLGGRDMLVLNLFAFHPERQHWEIARTDSLHHSFNVMRGTEVDGALVLFERNPRPDSDVRRRLTYKRLNADRFSTLLEFSLDDGKTWKRRNETFYDRVR